MKEIYQAAYERLPKFIEEDELLLTYRLTRQVFINTPLKNYDDLLVKIGLAYSWMPTIPKLRIIDNGQDLVDKLIMHQSGHLEHLENTLALLIPLCNNSIAGTSKVLYFINPELFPILDSNVRKGWNSVFKKQIQTKQGDVKAIPVLYSKSIKQKTATYLYYQNHLLKWKNALDNDISLRDIEYKLFLYGRSQ